MPRKLVLVLLISAGMLSPALGAAAAAAKPAAVKHHSAKTLHGRHGLSRAMARLHHRKGWRRPVIRVAIKPYAVPTPLPDSGLPPAVVVRAAYASCNDAPEAFVRAAAANASSLETLAWAPFGVAEHGWEVYDQLIRREIGTSCGSGTPVFAQALAAFQARYSLPANGVMDPATFEIFKGVLQERRAFVMDRVHGICPDAPGPERLVTLPKEAETFEREDRRIRADVWEAYQRLVAAARAEVPAVAADPKALTIFSAFRSPGADAARCGSQGNCDGLRRAYCSAHRTGAALDLNVGWIDGVAADSTTAENRLLQTRSAAYRWLVANAARFGFVNYPYEPWHWEYVGEAAASAPPSPPQPPTTVAAGPPVPAAAPVAAPPVSGAGPSSR
jgi:hypothetical protein